MKHLNEGLIKQRGVVKVIPVKGKKYSINPGESKEIDGVSVYRIIAEKTFKNLVDGRIVKKGDIGGWIEDERNLSQDGSCWVAGDAVVCDEALVKDDAIVKDNAVVCDNALVRDFSNVNNKSYIGGYATIQDGAICSGVAQVDGNAIVKDQAFVGGAAHVTGHAIVDKKSRICRGIIKRNYPF